MIVSSSDNANVRWQLSKMGAYDEGNESTKMTIVLSHGLTWERTQIFKILESATTILRGASPALTVPGALECWCWLRSKTARSHSRSCSFVRSPCCHAWHQCPGSFECSCGWSRPRELRRSGSSGCL